MATAGFFLKGIGGGAFPLDFFAHGLSGSVTENPANDGDKLLLETGTDTLRLDPIDFLLIEAITGGSGATIFSTAVATPPVDYVWLDDIPLENRKIKRKPNGER